MEVYKFDYTYINTVINQLKEACKKYYDYIGVSSNFEIETGMLRAIRSSSYNGLKWDISAGLIDTSLLDFLKKNYLYLYNLCSGKIIFTDNKGNEIDFTHFCATLDAYRMDNIIPKEWAGWQGDLATLTLDVVKKSNNSENYDLLISYARTMLGTPEYSFSKEDINSDIDASNIYNYMKQSNLDFVTAFKNYYYNYMNMSRFNRFITYMGDEAFYIMMKGPAELIYTGLQGYPGLGKTPSITQQKAVSGTFANFVFEKRDSSIT